MYTTKLQLARIAQLLRSGELDLYEYINSTLERVEKVEPVILALLPEEERRQRLFKEAELLLKEYPLPADRPPLFGVLIGVKDIFNVEGFVTKAGSRLPSSFFAGQEAEVVTKLRNAGAIILGKTVTTELAYFDPGPTRNPVHINHTPGGSSSGSAAAVAAGFCPLALGSQTIGSVIRPAAYCGVIGYKPSHDRIPTAGVLEFAHSADHIGFFTQDMDGIMLAASLLCRDWKDNKAQSLQNPVLAVPVGAFLQQTTPQGMAGFARQLESLRAKGYRVIDVPALADIAEINKRHNRMIFAEMAQVHQTWYDENVSLYGHHASVAITEGRAVSDAELAQARAGREELRNLLEQLLERHGAHLWVTPAATGIAPEGQASTGSPLMNLPWTYAGMPAITLPAGTAEGLPLGLQLVGRYGEDEALISWSRAVARSLLY